MITLSSGETRKLALIGQGLLRQREFGVGLAAARRAVQRLGYVQIDTISVVERAHHHTIWNRVESYQPHDLDRLLEARHVFEYWSHAAAYLPIEHFRYSLPRKQAFLEGKSHWHSCDAAVLNRVRDQITHQGPLRVSDFKHSRSEKSSGWWDWKPAKIALEQLFMRGELMISERRGFQKVYDLTERVLPIDIDTSMPTQKEQMRYFIKRYLACHGLATPAEMGHLQKGIKAQLEATCLQMVENGELVAVQSNGGHFFASSTSIDGLSARLSQRKVKILSPFDNLVIQRPRISQIFGFDYQLECYVPEAKRVFGYFVLPILWGQKMAARMDARVDRKTGVLTLHLLSIETPRVEEFVEHLVPALRAYREFNNATHIRLSKVVTLDGEMNNSGFRELAFQCK